MTTDFESLKKDAIEKMNDYSSSEASYFYSQLDPRLQTDGDIVAIGFDKIEDFYSLLPKEVSEDKNAMLKAIENNAFRYVAFLKEQNPLYENIDIIRCAIEQEGTILEHVPEIFQDNDELVKLAIERGTSEVITHASERLQNDWNIISVALDTFPQSLLHLHQNVLCYPEKSIRHIGLYDFITICAFCQKDKIETIHFIKDKLVKNQDSLFINSLKKEFSINRSSDLKSGWNPFLTVLDNHLSASKKKQELLTEIKFVFSYLLSQWPLDFIERLEKKTNHLNFKSLELKEAFNCIFKEEFTRRNIVSVRHENVGQKEKKKLRTLKF
jgi:hypothetical protein